jgi:hypothetical protein
MVDRTDIDALLIGALYGELAPADEARLTAHLESHPVDRTALDDMARTRAAIRESRILAAQLEPPHAISTLLLHEASRRAPRGATALPVDGESESWFQRFVRSFVAHPALAAAATLVLVVGVAGGLYLRGDAQFASPSAPAFERAKAEQVDSASPDVAAAGSDGKRARLDEAAGGAPVPGQTAAMSSDDEQLRKGAGGGAPPPAKAIAKLGAADQPAGRAAEGVADKDVALARPSRTEAKADSADRKKAKKPRGIELHSPELSPRELADGDVQRHDRRAAAAPPSPPAVAGASNEIAVPAAPPAAADPAPDAKPARETAVLDWARKQHDQVIALVVSNRCRDAANAAVEIYNRAPDYFAANIVTDRQIKPCMAYVNNQRERAERSRATSKNANDAYMTPPAQAAPPARK